MANGAGVKTSALITDMNEPLAASAGNALEVLDAVRFLRGENTRSRLDSVVMSLSAELLVLGGLAKGRDEARAQLRKALDSGKAAEVFEKMVSGLGGPGDLVARPMEYLPVAEVRAEVPALSGGWVDRIDTRELGMAVVELGGGRKRAEDGIDYAVGLSGFVELGQNLEEGEALCQVHARREDDAARAIARVQNAISLSEDQSSGQPVVYEVISG